MTLIAQSQFCNFLFQYSVSNFIKDFKQEVLHLSTRFSLYMKKNTKQSSPTKWRG